MFLSHICSYFYRIASLSLGGEREFYLKNKADNKLVEKYLLQNGDMVVMQGETQGKWLHAIPKRTHAEPRIKYLTALYNELTIASRSAELSIRLVLIITTTTMSMRGIYSDG
jgi:hypothetical protein